MNEDAKPDETVKAEAHKSRKHSRRTLLIAFLVLSTLTGSGFWMTSWLARFRPVIPGQIYRSGQPTMSELSDWIDEAGLKTIVDLRGPTAPMAREESEAAAAKGVNVIFIQLSAYKLIPPKELRKLIEVLDHAERPILLHCRHGVDRAGTASAIAALLAGEDYDTVKGHAFVLPGPWKRRHGPLHISDTLTLYEKYCRDHSLSPEDPAHFRDWAANVYGHPAADSDPNAPVAPADSLDGDSQPQAGPPVSGVDYERSTERSPVAAVM